MGVYIRNFTKRPNISIHSARCPIKLRDPSGNLCHYIAIQIADDGFHLILQLI